MTGARDRQASCGFCDGTGEWIDPDGATADPCPLCDGSGATPSPIVAATPTQSEAPVTLDRIVAMLGDLTQAERQQLYEMLHVRYDCRIYR